MIAAPSVRIVTTAVPSLGLRSPIDLSNRVLRFTYEDRDDAVDKVTVQLANPDLVLLDRHDVLGGAVWQVSWGLGGEMTRPRAMSVRTVRGVEVLTVEGHARHIALDQVARSRTFHGQTRSQVMQQVAAEHGYQGLFAQIADTEERFETIHQVAETDARFLRRLARLEDFLFSLDDERLVIGPASSLLEPARVFHWRPGRSDGDVKALNVESNLALIVGKVELRGRDPKEKKTVTATATRTPDEQRGLDGFFDRISGETGRTRVEERTAPPGTATLTQPTTVTSPAGAQRKASARLRRLDADAVKVTMQVLGDATLRTRQVVELRGASRRLSGRYLVRAVKHQISAEGYVVELTARRFVGGEGATVPPPGTPPPASSTDAQTPPAARPPTPIDLIDPETGRTEETTR